MTDVVVVGGGIIGLATARALCLRGVGVTVLERGMVASGTSSRGEGNMLVSDKEIPAEASLALRSLSLWREFAEQSTVPFEYEEKGGIITARTDRQLELLVAQSRRQSTLGSGIGSTVLDREDLLGAEPNLDPGLVGGIHYPQDAQVMPIQASQALAFAVEELGGTIRTGVTVTGLSRRGGGRGGPHRRRGRTGGPGGERDGSLGARCRTLTGRRRVGVSSARAAPGDRADACGNGATQGL